MQKRSLLILTCLLAACQTPQTPVIPSPTPSASPSAETTPSPLPSAEPSALPSIAPSAIPEPTPTPSFVPMPLPSLIPVASPNPNPWGEEYLADLTGRVFNELGQPLQGVKVKVFANAESQPPSVETLTDAEGWYRLKVPNGSLVKIYASASGYSSRSRIEVMKMGTLGHPFANRFDFGVNELEYIQALEQSSRSAMDASRPLALENAPEVIALQPELKQPVAANQTLTLTFNEPMDRDSVEKSLAIRALNNQKLAVDQLSSQDTFTGPGDSEQTSGSLIWTAEAFDFKWNPGDTVLMLQFKPGHAYPANHNQKDFPSLQLTWNAPGSTGLRDKSGASRTKNEFRLNEQISSQSVTFSIAPDLNPFQLKSLAYQTTGSGPVLVLSYNKTLWYETQSRIIAGGMADHFNLRGAEIQAPAEYPGNQGNATAQNAAKNYRVLITNPQSEIEPNLFSGTWFELGGQVVYDSTDPNHQRVLLQLPSTTRPELFQSGHEIALNGVISVLDPAGNPLTVGTPLKVTIP
ncbi:hypothetical protein COW36_16135 [bacterium (Candidatus Blackallbacteria) CG17_big_fil_post_rev_8_21_14_2_50_48_46]|uniref:SbsA Ig-like domain-containing protein n=1 Tax=bacterium (Candidatus Blackallbacteria) CG17_big_fil_post_rev_8_21_14_2_50_48_46 TaxID=2014261 RepID=A0A2M7G1V5_9BACT|nr:MAG: hypothetical protein COW64_08530 [bacterium (Candidatus Blackallbacteria) CG18_big_fil_WC_8_21_14_2_50_49_26]PIW15732.1 MAG: hypothetical protein COW36_16135 [bacterium (Candidatus Blackallbacteria) CG17_big_fil_post_rev_8_21_14_2_50_48_46]PIW49234.1 MAG: hypothetical protein COW20_06645 [bacterium (Candidatus Blackallbacteria) CG13_big_fil_rev_8_21_14_2_50_49_14]